jgi:hypothetical protein
MHVELLRSLPSPLRLWRTTLLMILAGYSVAWLSGDALAVLCATLGCAFVFSAFERREWITMPAHVRLGDVVARISLAFVAAFFLLSSQGALFDA